MNTNCPVATTPEPEPEEEAAAATSSATAEDASSGTDAPAEDTSTGTDSNEAEAVSDPVAETEEEPEDTNGQEGEDTGAEPVVDFPDEAGADGEAGETEPTFPEPSWEDYLECQEREGDQADAEAQQYICSFYDNASSAYWDCYWGNESCDSAAGDSDWYSCYWYQQCPEAFPEFSDFAGYLECVEGNSVENCNTADEMGDYYNCYWNNIGCDDLGQEDGWYDCFWYDRCDAVPEETNEVEYLDWLDCYVNTSADAETCGDVTGAYGLCYWSEECESVINSAWHDCYFYDRGCADYNGCETYACNEGTDSTGGDDVSFYEWLDCYRNTDGGAEECGDASGDYYGCYMYETCDGIADPAWHDCYWYDRGCGAYNGCDSYDCPEGEDGDSDSGESGTTFHEWLDCYQDTRGTCGDDSGAYYDCYMWESCEGIVSEYWHDCFWYGTGCDMYDGTHSGGDTGPEEPEYVPDDPAHDGQAGPSFRDWIECYESSYYYSDWDACGESEAQRSAYYDCYWYGENCEDEFWFDCHWEEQDCSWMEGQDPDWIRGYKEGYEGGYWDGVLENVKQPRDADIDEFYLQMLISSFEDWVQDQELRSGRFYCNSDVRVDFPFDDDEYMALWAAHDCSDWDLYLTVVVDEESADLSVAWSGAEPSDRKGCYETSWFDDVYACEFYLPHGGDKFGLLFAGGFHAVWHELEWDYNPGWNSIFGGW